MSLRAICQKISFGSSSLLVQLFELLVVEAGLGDSLLEDGRVGGDADDSVVDHGLQVSVLYVVAGEGVYPDALPDLLQLL